MVKVAILHTDFRIYWPARLNALSLFLKDNSINLEVVEIAGLGSHYDFADRNQTYDLVWRVLFPSEKIENLKSSVIETVVLKSLTDINPDIVIAGAIAFPSGALAVRWARKHHKKVIIFDDARIDHVHRNFFVNYIKQKVYNGVDAMLYPSPAWEKTGYFWNFKSEELFYGLDVVDNVFWQRHLKCNIDLPDNYFLCVGRQIKKKNFLFVLNAYNAYCKLVEFPYKLLIVGDGPEHENLIRYVEKEQLQNFIIFKSFVQQDDLVILYRKAQALIVPSIFGETWGLVINEAMASGLPIIASNQCGATSTLVLDKKNGYTFSPYDQNQLEEKLLDFHNLSCLEKKRMSQNSLNIIKSWNLNRFAESLYRAILFVQSKHEKKISVMDRLIINLWRGRYRPL